MKQFSFLLTLSFCLSACLARVTHCAEIDPGVEVAYQLPATGVLPQTYLVTLAITDPKNPASIVSTFVAGQPRTVTLQNKGQFKETWDGLDENFMPVPPGQYGVKGIYMAAKHWPVDDEWHSITPLFAGGVSAWLPPIKDYQKPIPFGGDPVLSPLKDVAVGPNGVAVFYYQYLENGKNCPMFDLNKPLGAEQFLRAFNSGGAAGGPCLATDGETVWAFSSDGGPKFVYRPDGKSFGSSPTANRRNSYLPEGWVTAMAALRDSETKKSAVYIAQRGKIVQEPGATKGKDPVYRESKDESINRITIHDGEDGTILTSVDASKPQGLAVQDAKLYVLHTAADGWAISSVALEKGLPKGTMAMVFQVPTNIQPADLEVDKSGRFYLSDTAANKVYQMDAKGKLVRAYGRMAEQKPGKYDRETFISPAKLATWTDAQGKDRLIVAELDGPNRVSEWSADDGTLLREFPTYQTRCNNGYAVDPEDASLIYMPGHGSWLTRFKVDYQSHQWTVDAVWPGVPSAPRKGLTKPRAIRANKNLYLASEQTLSIYRLLPEGDRWVPSAGILQEGKTSEFWNDANGNFQMDPEERRPAELPGKVLTYHGQKWLPDFSYISPAQGDRTVWRLAPTGFDTHGNPIFEEWKSLFTDPILEARAKGQADFWHGGNELADKYNSDWMQVDGSMQDGFYVQARGGQGFTANYGIQHKISRYVPTTNGYKLMWRMGRTRLSGYTRRGEIEGAMRIFKPLNGLLAVVDQSRSGLLLYTEDGLYVDTIFPPEAIKRSVGVYAQPGEFFAGTVYSNPSNGKIYYATGKFTPLLFEMEGWSLQENPVRKLDSLQESISIKATQIADPPEIALSIRGGAGKSMVARFSPALGGVELDGSLRGWETADPVRFGAGKDQAVEVRCLYDPNFLYLRWHVKLDSKFQAKALPPLERIFTHDQESDTVGFYIQGDLQAASNGPVSGRSGDVRFVFGIFKNGETLQPVVTALYPDWKKPGASAQIYRTPVGTASFAHVGPPAGAKLGSAIDSDGKGFVIAAAIPRAAIPAMNVSFDGDLRTLVNFDANLGGHNKFWWANSDGSASPETYDEASEARLYPGSWAQAQFLGLKDGFVIPNWLVLGPFGGAGAERFNNNPRNKDEVRDFYENASYPPDTARPDLNTTYDGSLIQGYWRDPKSTAWKSRPIVQTDTRVDLGLASQVWYGATWIYSAESTELEFEFQGHRMSSIRWFLNNVRIDIPANKITNTSEKGGTRTVASLNCKLKPGWNEVFFRGYALGYAAGRPFKAGLVLKAPPEKLWPLRFSTQPPSSSSKPL